MKKCLSNNGLGIKKYIFKKNNSKPINVHVLNKKNH